MFSATLQNFLVYFVEQDIIDLALLCGVYIVYLSTHTS